ncbi:hypothetical protein Apmu_0159_09 [Acidiphilium multivorum AIU301]|nr:hypothetical protein Apmu_0159_09 [Acidiphilium multivorum AIU301]
MENPGQDEPVRKKGRAGAENCGGARCGPEAAGVSVPLDDQMAQLGREVKIARWNKVGGRAGLQAGFRVQIGGQDRQSRDLD